jgi:glycosyltransferase involved in cell wall biosynthesis
MPDLTVAILACNNEDDIAECLVSVEWADERIVILDTRTTDRTAAIAQMLGARVVRHAFVDFAQQREFGLTQATGGWLFYVDSDERGTPALGSELRRVMQQHDCVGWWVPRRTFIWGREIRHGGWWPDHQLRMLKLGHVHYDPDRRVHELPILDGEAGYLREPLIHYNYRTLGQFVAKQRQYVDYEVENLWQRGVRPRPWTYLLQPLREFWRRYVRLGGILDGVSGLVLSALVAYYYGFVVTVKLGRRARQA